MSFGQAHFVAGRAVEDEDTSFVDHHTAGGVYSFKAMIGIVLLLGAGTGYSAGAQAA
jgi:hypothetical protein